MAPLIEESPPLPGSAHVMGLRVMISKRIWNSYDAVKEPTYCKVRLFRFHYGGPQRQRKGQCRHEITYEHPCLQPTCANCRNWHAHFLLAQELPHSADDGYPDGKPEQEPISPDIDPRILDGSWQLVESRPTSAGALRVAFNTVPRHMHTPVFTPVSKFFRNDQPSPNLPNALQPLTTFKTPSTDKYTIFLPTFLVVQSISSAPAHTQWRSTPRKRYTARLVLPSQEGKHKFELLLKKNDQRDKRREYDRARREGLKERRRRGS
ncbi:hypothetical protein EJ02DRAFT_154133 [Clathrospora elynae]|uniref:Uncharacterized protein n=1 Tax=Clathrospora elynae TaxID=706981 RepID=A0A6A5SQL1_9PLEO|nr:hypothetical protein EJ02DRAFT_154133 [Clathrospora elynae]